MKYIIILLLIFFYSCTTVDKSKPIICDKTILEYSGNKDEDVYLIGDFNNWTLTTPMEYTQNNIWQVSLTLPPKDYGYLFYSKKDKKRHFDINNQLSIYKDGIKSSRLIVEDCKYPKLSLKDFIVNEKEYSFTVEYNGANKIDLKNSKIYLNGYITNNFLYKDKKFYINEKNLENGKYSYLFKIKDEYGVAAESLHVPIWIENEKFMWKDAIIYQIMTDRFNNGSLNNDAPIKDIDEKANWQGGDYKGVIQKIDDGYFTELGINTIWISSPILNTDKAGKGMGGDTRYYAPYHSYWPIATGYNDFLKIKLDSPLEPHFGTSDELKELVNKAHKEGIRVLFDVIPNHVHTDSYMWQNYNNADWFHLEANGSPYICGWERPISCWFNRYLADIDHKNNDASMFVINHLIWLAKEYDIDGFRVDAIRLMITEFTETLNYYIKKELETTNIKFYIIGENFTSEIENDLAFDVIGEYLGENRLVGLFNFPLLHELSRTFFLQNESLIDFENYLENNIDRFQEVYYEDALMGNFLGNHDLARAISVANGDFTAGETNGGYLANARVWNDEVTVPTNPTTYKKLTMAQTVMMTLSDVPILYQGDEFGFEGANDPDNRRMMKFDDELTTLQKESLERFKILSKLRHSNYATKTNFFKTLYLSEDTWVYYKNNGEDFIIVALNRSTEKTINLDLSLLNLQASELTNIFNNQKFQISNGILNITIPEMESMVLK